MRRPSARTSFGGALPAAACMAAIVLATSGCLQPRTANIQGQLRQSRMENDRLKAEVLNLQTKIDARDETIRTLRGLGEKRLELLFHVTGIELGRYTAGVGLDEKAGDDGIRVYIKPIDRDGHPIKAAGAVRIQLFDLAAEAKDNLIGTYDFPVEKIADYWAGGFATYHYRFDCPWKKPPQHSEITVRATFTDYLTGKTFTAQKRCQVKIPSSTR